jgi:Amt family ammonium transporter
MGTDEDVDRNWIGRGMPLICPAMDGSGVVQVLLIVFACGALLIRVGAGWYAAGQSRSKNAAGAALRNAADMAVAALAFWALGAAIMNGDAGLIFDAKGRASSQQLAQLVLVLIATAPVVGAAAERSRFFPVLAAPALLAAIVIPLAGRWAWNGGWLQRMGFVDVAGATVIHVTGGLCAAAGAVLVGPRSGKYNRDGSSNFIPGHSAPMASVGVMLMFAGWAPYVLAATLIPHAQFVSGVRFSAVSMEPLTLGRAAMNVILAAAAGAIVAAVVTRAKYGKPEIMLTYSGLLGALVAISAAGGAVTTIAAVVVGAVAGVIVPLATVQLDLVWKLDDPVGGVAVHVLGGAWGTIAAGVFVPAATYGEKFRDVGVQVLGLAVIAAPALALSLAVFALLKRTVGLRLSEDAEWDGVDLAEHDLNAYPDFQQTMIKSYHLREA